MVEDRGAAEEVHMRLDEARNDGIAGGVDEFCAGALEVADRFAVADRNDFAALDGNRLSPRRVRVHGQDAGVVDDQVGRLRHEIPPVVADAIKVARRGKP